jgi:hypothetical protein
MLHEPPSLLAVLALLAVALCWALAVVLFRVGVPGSAARKLSVLLVVEGITLASSGSVFPPEAARGLHPLIGLAQLSIHTLGDCALLALYPPFLAATLNTPLTRPFGRRGVQIGLALFAAVLFVAVMMAALDLLPLAITVSALYFAMTLLFWYALAASLHAWSRTTGTARARARSFALAFGIRDVCWSFIYALALLELWSVLPAADPDAVPLRYMVYSLGTLAAVPLIAYGILRTQLFDIDLRIRWTIKQSTVAAGVVAIVYLVSEGATQLLSSELGSVAGLLAAALVVFFLVTPLQRLADRVAGAAMPNTINTPAYVAHRKMQVYEAALAEALQDGGISPKERALLNRLRDSLGIVMADAEALERDLQTHAEAPGLADQSPRSAAS